MPLITVNNRQIDVDIRAELEQYDWTRAKWSHDKLIAASPFRYDNTPSFYCYLEDTPSAPAGSFGDSGAIDGHFAKGSLIRLLSFLRNEDEQSTIDYLLSNYSEDAEDFMASVPLSLSLREAPTIKRMSSANLDQCGNDYDYLISRGINIEILREMNVKGNKTTVAIPWYDTNKRLRTVKYRRTDSKVFWYEKDGTPTRELVYGIDRIYDKKANTAVIVEGEIDALYLMTAGFSAIATGGSSFNEIKRDIIARSPIKKLYIATDNDEAGNKLKRKIIESLDGYCEKMYDVRLPDGVKDVNEIGNLENLRGIVEKGQLVERILSLRL